MVVPEDEQGVEIDSGVFNVEEMMGLLDPERRGRAHTERTHRNKDDRPTSLRVYRSYPHAYPLWQAEGHK